MTRGQTEHQGELLRQERESRDWTRQQLADKIGVSESTIKRWELGQNRIKKEYIEILSKELGKSPDQWGTRKSPIWNVPFPQNRYFTGRESLLHGLHQTLAAKQSAALTQTQAISGLGGIGKTQAAIEYAHRYRDEYDAVLWVRADSSETLMSDFVALAALLNLPTQQERDQQRVISRVKHWLETHDSWLLICDNADDPTLITPFLPGLPGGAVLLTTRSQATLPHRKIDIGKLSLEEGVDFLLRRVWASKGLSFPEEVTPQDREEAEHICEYMDGLPLALDQAASYLEETGCSLTDYLDLLKTHSKDLLLRRGLSLRQHPEPVGRTLWLSFEKVMQANYPAAELLRFCAFLHPDKIPESLIIRSAGGLGTVLQSVASDKFDWNNALGELRKYSLISRNADKTLTLHRLVQAVIKDSMDAKTLRTWAMRTVLAIHQEFPASQLPDWSECELLMPHASLAAQYIEECQLIFKEAGELLYRMASYLYDRVRYSEAEIFHLKALHIREQMAEQEPLDLADSLDDLANIYRDQARYAEAEPLHLRALDIREHWLGLEHPDVADSLSGLGNIYLDQGRYKESEKFHLRALAIRKQQLGPEHLQVAISLNSMGLLYQEQGKYEEAAQFYLRSLAIRKQQLGPEHPQVGGSYNNLAILYMTQGEYVKAEALYQDSLAIAVKAYGEDNPVVATRFNNLGSIYFELKKYEDAISVFQKALHLWEKHLGETHPYVATAFGNLAETYTALGEYAEAESLFKKALYVRAQQSEQEHSAVAHLLDGLATLYQQQGRYEEAEPLYRQALAIHEKARGPEHSETAAALYNLAQLKEKQGNREDAKELYVRALAIQNKTLGTDHPKTVKTQSSLHALLHLLEMPDEAIRLQAVPYAPGAMEPYAERN